MKIKEALQTLDPEDDRLWTGAGLPKMSVIEELVGDKSITRQDVTDADPEFCRGPAPGQFGEPSAEEPEPRQCSSCHHRPEKQCYLNGQTMKDNDHCSQHKV